MEDDKTRYAVLRDRRNWDEGVTTTSLQPEPDGALTLARIPGEADGRPITLAGPFDAEPSGVAIGDCADAYVADTAHHRVIGVDSVCDARTMLPGCGGAGSAPGQFNQPRGLLLTHDSLFVADGGNGRIQVFRLPALALRAIWEGPLQAPTHLAGDSYGRIYVLDRGLKRVLRFSISGAPDAAYNAAMANSSGLTSPFALAIDGQDVLYVSDGGSNRVLRFDADGKALSELPTEGASLRPRALAAHGNRLFIADAEGGRTWVFDCAAHAYLGAIPGFRGPVAALAVDEAGALHIKPGLDDAVYTLQADATYAESGALTTAMLDAGEGAAWERVHVQADVPADTQVALETFVSASPTLPADAAWIRAHALDTLQLDAGQPASKRHLWIRVVVKSDDSRVSPRIVQVQAETAGESYMQHLPAVFRRDDAPGGFLERWLALFRAELGDWELALEDLSRRFDPATAPEDGLAGLAAWLALELPQDQGEAEWRKLLLRARELYELRGTPAGLREFVGLYTGVRPQLFEAFHDRHIWQLGVTSALGFDTALAPAFPDGTIVPGFTPADPGYMGLRGDYYSGINFDQLKFSRTDPTVDFDREATGPLTTDPPGEFPADRFSVRWTGQVQPRYSETYFFHTLSDDGVRLWVDGRLIIDNWTDHPPKEDSGQITLTAGRWYAIRLEYYENFVTAAIKLYWSSRSQMKEIIPQARLYSVRDEGADLEARAPGETVLVGQTVVGESGPLMASQFGMPLFGDTAHLFTMLVPAAQVREPAQRAMLRRVVEAEKPAHTDYHLCFVEARMRVGFQARVGVDSIVAGPPTPMALSGTTLGLDSYMGTCNVEENVGRVGSHARLGRDTVLG